MKEWHTYWDQNTKKLESFGTFAKMLKMPQFRCYAQSGVVAMEIRSVEENILPDGVVRWTCHGDFPTINVTGKYIIDWDPEYGVLSFHGTLTGGIGGSTEKMRGPFSPGVTIPVENPELLRMYSLNGGASTMQDYPPQAYAYRGSDRVYSLVSSLTGLSTDQEIPFAILADEEETYGCVTGMEYSGRWIFFAGTSQGSGGAGMDLNMFWHQRCGFFRLDEGEEAMIPGSFYCFYRGTPSDGSNQFRRYFEKRVRKAESVRMPVFYNHYFYHGNKYNEELLRKEADFYAAAGCEYFVVDGGWHVGSFRDGIGNWEEPDPAKFPSGMRAFSDYVHNLGMKFGLWFEPEFAMNDSDWYQKYPQYYMDTKGKINIRQGSCVYADRLFRMDLPEAREFLVSKLTELIRKWRIDWVRFDFNDAPGTFWDENEEVEKFGLLENRYCAGLYDFMERMKQENPHLQIETCAGGGHRMDFGMLRRSDTAWMSDLALPFDSVRRFQVNLNRYVPGMANSVFYTGKPVPAEGTVSFGPGKRLWTELFSKFAGPCGMSEYCGNFSKEGAEQLKAYITLYKQYRHYLVKDFYPVCDPRSMRDWDGWQFHDPETGSGIAAFFRCRSREKTFIAPLSGLETAAEYRTEWLGGSQAEVELKKEQITVTLNDYQDCVLIYYSKK